MVRVGICEDDKRELMILESLLREACLECGEEPELLCFENGDSLFENGKVYDGVFLDIELPGMDGIEIGRRIKAVDPYCVIVMATAFDDRIGEAIDMGARDYK